jgi:hypothetical protein
VKTLMLRKRSGPVVAALDTAQTTTARLSNSVVDSMRVCRGGPTAKESRKVARLSNRTPSGLPILNAGASRRSKKARSALASATPIAWLIWLRPSAVEQVIVSRSVLVDSVGSCFGAVAGPQGVVGAVLVDPLVGVRAEEVPLPLDQGGR